MHIIIGFHWRICCD